MDAPEIVEVRKALDAISNQVKEAAEKAIAEAKKTGDMSSKNKEDVDHLLIKFNETSTKLSTKQAELSAQMLAVEQLIVASKGNEPPKVKSFGEQVAESAGYKALVANGGRGAFSTEVKVVNSVAAASLIRPVYEDAIVALPRQRLTVRDLLNVIPIATSSVDYPKMATRTNLAATVAEGAAKPYSDYTWTNATALVRVIAHLAKLTRQAMDDAPRLVAEVDSEMRYGLALVEEAQLLNGNGTGQNLLGIIPQATAYVAPIAVPTPTRIDMLRLGMLQASLAMYPADGMVISEYDWAGIELTKTTQGAYLFANPQALAGPRMWGLPVVATQAMAIDKFLVANFRIGATLYDRMSVEVLISTENVDDFEKNLATMRAEERIALAVKRPGGFIYGDFGLVV